MKIIHLSTYDSDGAGGAATKINEILINLGYDSKLYVKHSLKSKNKRSCVYVQKKQSAFILRTWKKYRIYIKPFFKSFFQKRENSLESRYCFYQKQEMIENGINHGLVRRIKDVDILFVHWISNFVNLNDIKKIQNKTGCRVIFTMMDMAPVTGGCHFSFGCNLFKKNCSPCPALSYNQKHLAQDQLNIKSNIIAEIKGEILTFSKEYSSLAKESYITYNKIWYSLLPFNTENFTPNVNKPNRDKNGHHFTLFCGAYSLIDKRKGPTYLLNILLRLDKMMPENSYLKVLNLDLNFNEKFKFNHIIFEKFVYSTDIIVYSELYKKSDVFLFTSEDDAGPQMLVEALLCGTPVISFDVGNAAEIIENGIDGFVVKKYDCENMAKLTYETLLNPCKTLLDPVERHKRIFQKLEENNFVKNIEKIIENKN